MLIQIPSRHPLQCFTNCLTQRWRNCFAHHITVGSCTNESMKVAAGSSLTSGPTFIKTLGAGNQTAVTSLVVLLKSRSESTEGVF